MPRFYVDLPLELNAEISLPQEVCRHFKVLRLNSAGEIILFNGNGHDFRCKIITVDKRDVVVRVINQGPIERESTLELSVYLALIANDKFDLVLQKAVELGVSRLIPIFSQHVQRFNADKIKSRLAHWQKIVLAASEQSGRARLMALQPPQEYSQAICSCAAQLKVILSPYASAAKPARLTNVQTAALLIGPEGGFTAVEVALAMSSGFQSQKIGPRVLRAETAAIAGISLLQNTYGDLN